MSVLVLSAVKVMGPEMAGSVAKQGLQSGVYLQVPGNGKIEILADNERRKQ